MKFRFGLYSRLSTLPPDGAFFDQGYVPTSELEMRMEESAGHRQLIRLKIMRHLVCVVKKVV